jgi:hypothetical protein
MIDFGKLEDIPMRIIPESGVFLYPFSSSGNLTKGCSFGTYAEQNEKKSWKK